MMKKIYILSVLILNIFLVTGCKKGENSRWPLTSSDFLISSPLNPDTTAPTILVVVPSHTAVDMAINTQVMATFSEAIEESTINLSSFTLMSSGGISVAGTVTYVSASRIATFSPDTDLLFSTQYTATITTQITDLVGNPLAIDFVWTFITSAPPDITPPTILVVVPSNNAIDVGINTQVTAAFSEEMDAVTIDTTSFTLVPSGGIPVTGTVTYVVASKVAIFSPDVDLLVNTQYTATITTQVADLAGNFLIADFVWSFTTGSTLDITAPTVTAVTPLNNAVSVAINSDITASFSETIDAATINISSFTLLSSGGVSVTGTITYVITGSIATFSPDSDLFASTQYTATITTQVTDLAGNPLAIDFVWSFTTGVTSDTTAPRVIDTINADGATGVPINTQVGATFSEPMDSLTLTTFTFTFTTGGLSVPGVVNYSGVNAVFDPTDDLLPDTLYTATITTSATDLASNPLAVDYIWSFTTGAIPDTTPPTIILVNPSDLAIDICINKTISATFSEDMDPLTITNLTFFLEETVSFANVPGTVVYGLNNIATFTPSADLAINTQYTATITIDVTDISGNPLAVDFIWSFTTGTTNCIAPVPLGAAAPFGTIGGGAGITNQGLLTVVNGDMGTTGASTLVTGFQDSVGDIYTITPLNNGMVNGRIYTAPPPPGGAGVGGNAETSAIATQALSDATTAFNNLSPALLPGGIDPGAGQLGGLTLPAGIYQSDSGSFLITGSDLTLDAGGDPNAVFVFQMASTLDVGAPGAPRSVILINGAQAKNVFWQVGSSATINEAGGGTMVGTIISSATTTFSTADNVILVTLNGRALALNASVTMVNTIINVPAP